jgi:hypothetical protein
MNSRAFGDTFIFSHTNFWLWKIFQKKIKLLLIPIKTAQMAQMSKCEVDGDVSNAIRSGDSEKTLKLSKLSFMLNGAATGLRKTDYYIYLDIDRSLDLKGQAVPEKCAKGVTEWDSKTGTVTQYTWTALQVDAKAKIVVGAWPRNEERHTYQPLSKDSFDSSCCAFTTPVYVYPFRDLETKSSFPNGSALTLTWYIPNSDTAILKKVEYRSMLLTILPKSPVAKCCKQVLESCYDYYDDNEDEEMSQVTQQMPWDLKKKA